MSTKVHLCDNCGDFKYEIDLMETCYNQMMCEDCMIDFTQEQEHERHQ